MKTYHFNNVAHGNISPSLFLVSSLTCQEENGQWWCEMLPDWLESSVKCVNDNCSLFLETHLKNYCLIIGTAIAAMGFVIYVLDKQKDKIV